VGSREVGLVPGQSLVGSSTRGRSSVEIPVGLAPEAAGPARRPAQPRDYTRQRARRADRESLASSLDGLATLATGSFGLWSRGRFLTEATRATSRSRRSPRRSFGFLAVLADAGLPTVQARPRDPARLGVGRAAPSVDHCGLVVIAVAYGVRLARGPSNARPRRAGLVAGPLGVAVRGRSAGAAAGSPACAPARAVLLAAVLGGVGRPMVLAIGISLRPGCPRRRWSGSRAGSGSPLAAQLGLFVAWLASAPGRRGPPRSPRCSGRGRCSSGCASRRPDLPADRQLVGGPDRAHAVDGVGRPACCTSTSARSPAARSSPPAVLGAGLLYEPEVGRKRGQRDRSWSPDATDLDWIEDTSRAPHPVLLEMEAARARRGPILSRDSGRMLAVLAADRRRVVEVGTAIGYSTPCG